jgi:hypothetical protein
VRLDVELRGEDLKELVQRYEEVYRKLDLQLPSEPLLQLREAICAVFRSAVHTAACCTVFQACCTIVQLLFAVQSFMPGVPLYICCLLYSFSMLLYFTHVLSMCHGPSVPFDK